MSGLLLILASATWITPAAVAVQEPVAFVDATVVSMTSERTLPHHTVVAVPSVR